ncbi:hypothetical protein FN846DRAFT_926821 [Sphaerosporella brunnea]|uniref:BSD domain-containing protein n=1 Tax=Sphaerosporella brunnea TaxID=1250544 RepID=A0A5J5FBD2_9PEZI|nr:hypothetical protein FN846DRAFT_926821 [Sphaerosporella brunnea]
MSTVKGLTTFKKKDGTLQLTRDIVTWAPAAPPNSPPTVTIQVGNIENLQATPATSVKVMIKIFTKEGDTSESYVFNFTAASARAEADAMKAALSDAIAAAKAGTAVPGGPGGASSATIAATAAGASTTELMNEARLAKDMDLQMSLLKSDAALSNTFREAVMLGTVTSEQFWSTRTHLLRAHALEKSQARAPYNVLSTFRVNTIDGAPKMSLSREQIAEIFRTHPLVKKVYDENVPRVPEDQFFSRFFLSRLFKTLKGDKLSPADPMDVVFDRYLNREDEEYTRKRRKVDHVPLTIDLEGNEQNISKNRGNAPDVTMRPSRMENVPVIRTLNSISLQILNLVAPTDTSKVGEGSGEDSRDRDEEYIASQRLTDLGGDPEEERIILNIQDQRKFFSNEDGGKTQNRFAGMDAASVLQTLRQDLGDKPFDIADLLPGGGEDDEDVDEPNPAAASASKAGFHSATKQVTEAVRDRSSQLLTLSTGTNSALATGGLPREVFDAVQSVHATTNEFLRHFWLAFLSGDEKRAKDINSMVTSLRNSKERIEAVAKNAEEQREELKVQRKKDLHEEYKKTGIKPKKKDMEVGGGKKVVDEMLGPTLVAIDKALAKYQAALDEAERLTPGGGGTAAATPVGIAA